MSELVLLDVAHGNAALLVTDQGAAVFDAAPRDALVRAIRHFELTTIEHLFISHADGDHVGGLAALLPLPWLQVRNLHLNPDSTKHGPEWERSRRVIDDAIRRYGLRLHPLFSGCPAVPVGDASVVALAPPPSVFLSGPGGVAGGTSLTSNSASAVLALDHQSHRVALFAGDMNSESLDRILSDGGALRADILIFPHHGGLSGGDTGAFAERLAGLVRPRLTVFSIGRRQFNNPRPEVVAGVQRAVPSTHILCTQLSTWCADEVPDVPPERLVHLNLLPSTGSSVKECCGGSVYVRLAGRDSTYSPAEPHRDFVRRFAPTALCRRLLYAPDPP